MFSLLTFDFRLSTLNFPKERTMKKDLSRRQFLHRTAGAAGALAASPAIFLDPEHIPLPMQTVAPSDRLRFGIIGIGMQGSGLLHDALQLPGVECVAACDLYDGRHTLAREIVGKRIFATLYDGVGSVKRHLDCARRGGSFFSFFPKRIFSLSCISTKARFVNRAVETGSTNHLFGYPEGEP